MSLNTDSEPSVAFNTTAPRFLEFKTETPGPGVYEPKVLSTVDATAKTFGALPRFDPPQRTW